LHFCRDMSIVYAVFLELFFACYDDVVLVLGTVGFESKF
jgi:hypothetical protein